MHREASAPAPGSLRYAESIPREDIWDAHLHAKQALCAYVQSQTGAILDPQKLTLGFARRFTAYKRPDLLFQELGRLTKISEQVGAFQVVCSGKAHPRDKDGKLLIERICQIKTELQGKIDLIYLQNYDLEIAKLLTSGVDVWLNTPQPPMEASGTSGMKAAVNGVPSLSILDGWWIEGWIEGVTGWAIGSLHRTGTTTGAEDANSLYEKLENQILPAFYHNQQAFIEIMRHCIAINASFFNTQRMLHQYVLSAYFR